jgi:hypothetical protein
MRICMGRAAWAVLVTALVVTGCGGNDTTDRSTTITTLSEVPTTAQATTTSPPQARPADNDQAGTSTSQPNPEGAIQVGNRNPTSAVVIQPSTALPIDDRLGVGLYPAYPDLPAFDYLLAEFVASGVHRIDLSYADIEYPIDWSYSETEIDPAFDQFIDNLNNQHIAIDYMLHFWDKEGHAAGRRLTTPRFQTEDQIQDFLDYISSIVERYEGRIQYYTIWSEPDACGDGGIKCIEPSDYLALAERVIPLIHEIDPQAKVALAPVVLFHARDYMASLVESDVIGMFDVIQWHGIYNVTVGDTPVGSYYEEYPSIVSGIRDTAAANGFEGEYWCTEITYCEIRNSGCPPADPPLSDLQVAKYYARSMVQHLGMDMGTSYKTYRDTTSPVTFAVFGRLHTLLSGTTPRSLEVGIETEATNVASAAFTTASGDDMLALWIDGAPSDDDHGTTASLTFADMAGRTATGIDVISGVRQQLVTTDQGTELFVSDLLISDAPVIVRLEG